MLDANGYNQSLFETGVCHICGARGDLIRHEIYGGSRRQLSKRLGLWVNLCPSCHLKVHSYPERYLWLKREGEILTHEIWKWTPEDFREVIGKNYGGME